MTDEEYMKQDFKLTNWALANASLRLKEALEKQDKEAAAYYQGLINGLDYHLKVSQDEMYHPVRHLNRYPQTQKDRKKSAGQD